MHCTALERFCLNNYAMCKIVFVTRCSTRTSLDKISTLLFSDVEI